MFDGRDTPRELETLRKINDQREENAKRLRELNLRFEEMAAELGRINADEQQLLADIEATPDEADRATLQLRASSLRERSMQLEDEYSRARNRFEAVAAEAETLVTRAHEALEKLNSAGIETQKMLFETGKPPGFLIIPSGCALPHRCS